MLNRIRKGGLNRGGAPGDILEDGVGGALLGDRSTKVFKVETRKTERLQKTRAFASLKKHSVYFFPSVELVESVGLVQQSICSASLSAHPAFSVDAYFKVFVHGFRTVKRGHTHSTHIIPTVRVPPFRESSDQARQSSDQQTMQNVSNGRRRVPRLAYVVVVDHHVDLEKLTVPGMFRQRCRKNIESVVLSLHREYV